MVVIDTDALVGLVFQGLPESLVQHFKDAERARRAGARVPADIDPETYRGAAP